MSINTTKNHGILGSSTTIPDIWRLGGSEIDKDEATLIIEEMQKFKNQNFVSRITDKMVFVVPGENLCAHSEKLFSRRC